MSTDLYFVAAEASGDQLGREVIDAVRSERSGLAIAGIGGEAMAGAGIVSPIDTSPLSIIGFIEGIKAYSTVTRLADEAADAIVQAKPRAVVLIDSWGFMLRVAQRLRKRAPEIHLIKLIGPQVWATRPGRTKTLAATVDHLLCIHDFEAPYYAPFGLRTTVIGPPALARLEQGDGKAFRSVHGMGDDQDMVLVLPGSRRSEIAGVAPALMDAARALKSEKPNRAIVVAPAGSVAEAFGAAFPDAADWTLRADGGSARRDAMAAATLVLACSGTVTTEVAIQSAPMIVGYRTGWLTWAIARGILYQRKHITLLNIASDDTEVVPEFVQTRLKADLIAETASKMLADPSALTSAVEAQNAALKRMGLGGPPAYSVAAEAILKDLDGL